MQVTPLRYGRRYAGEEKAAPRYVGEIKTAPRYGAQIYLTNDSHFIIFYDNNQWRINPHWAAVHLIEAVQNAGLYDTSFPRRLDAVLALQQVLDSLEVSA